MTEQIKHLQTAESENVDCFELLKHHNQCLREWSSRKDQEQKKMYARIDALSSLLEKQRDEWQNDSTNLAEWHNDYNLARDISNNIKYAHGFSNVLMNRVLTYALSRPICSKTEVVFEPAGFDKDVNRAQITVGSFGYGICYNVQSRAISRMHEVLYLLRNKEAVLQGLKSKGMGNECIFINRFADAVWFLPYVSADGVRVDLEHPVDVITAFHNVKLATQLFIGKSYRPFGLLVEDPSGLDAEYIGLNSHDALSWAHYIRVRPQLKELFEKASEIATLQLDDSMVEQVREKLAKYVFMGVL